MFILEGVTHETLRSKALANSIKVKTRDKLSPTQKASLDAEGTRGSGAFDGKEEQYAARSPLARFPGQQAVSETLGSLRPYFESYTMLESTGQSQLMSTVS